MSTPENVVSESRSSVEISTTAAGKETIRVKVYAQTHAIEDAQVAADEALRLYNNLKANLTNPAGGA